MAWNTDKAAGDLIQSQHWDSMVAMLSSPTAGHNHGSKGGFTMAIPLQFFSQSAAGAFASVAKFRAYKGFSCIRMFAYLKTATAAGETFTFRFGNSATGTSCVIASAASYASAAITNSFASTATMTAKVKTTHNSAAARNFAGLVWIKY